MARRSHSHTTDQKRRLVASSLRGRAVRLASRDSKWSRRRFRFFTRRLPWLTVFLTCLICPPACRNVGVVFRRLVNSEQLGLTRTRYYWAVSNFHERTEASHAYEPRRTLG